MYILFILIILILFKVLNFELIFNCVIKELINDIIVNLYSIGFI